MKKRTNGDFIIESNHIHNFKYTYERSTYAGSHTKTTITCSLHGDFNQTPANHLQGHGCPVCKMEVVARSRRRTQKEFISSAYKIHGDLYDYSQSTYKNDITKVLIKCNTHGPFYQTPNNHLRGSGCPECGRTLSKGEKTVEHILLKNNITFKKQSTFPNLKGKRKHLLCDFWLPEHNTIIEYDGIQHFRSMNFTSSQKQSRQNFIALKECDAAKDLFAKENNLTMLRIPHYYKTEIDITKYINDHLKLALV